MRISFEYDPALREYMQKKGMTTIAVEVISSNSDFEITELHIHLISDKQRDYFKEKKGFRAARTEVGEVLLPNYRLEYDDVVTFELKKHWIFHSIRAEGIRL